IGVRVVLMSGFMREVLLAVSIVAGLIAVQLVARVLSTPTLLMSGLLAIGAGLVVSVPAAILYHVRLAQVLGRRGELPPGWLWHPTRFHSQLQPKERLSVLSWFAIGVLGWTASVVGCAMVGLSLLGLA